MTARVPSGGPEPHDWLHAEVGSGAEPPGRAELVARARGALALLPEVAALAATTS
ncbi:hypothetical protein [Streptomyces triticirhizae]|uniref:hypothetical protein n=1 Tax=Streptomyces triticirhizae TaxID=2483353 RepID=UPI0013157A80|nr:hypothetical protein [Streptomyces triticirhizae]